MRNEERSGGNEQSAGGMGGHSSRGDKFGRKMTDELNFTQFSVQIFIAESLCAFKLWVTVVLLFPVFLRFLLYFFRFCQSFQMKTSPKSINPSHFLMNFQR